MFSLGMCMYESMSCILVPPKEYSIFEFDEELKNGIRPGFLENVLAKKYLVGIIIMIIYLFLGSKVSSSSLRLHDKLLGSRSTDSAICIPTA